jgi:hypothetical protein
LLRPYVNAAKPCGKPCYDIKKKPELLKKMAEKQRPCTNKANKREVVFFQEGQ